MKTIFYYGGMALGTLSLFKSVSHFYMKDPLMGIGWIIVLGISVFIVKKGL